jgi:hypothetical protein
MSSTTFGPKNIATIGRGLRVLIDITKARWKPGGVTIDWSTVERGRNEKVTITIDATGGTFTITFGGQTTGALAYNASADTVEAALEGLSSIGNGNVQVSLATSVYTLEFVEDLRYTDVGAVTTNAGSLTGGASTATVAVTQAGVSNGEVTLGDGTVIPANEKYILPGTVLSKITASSKYGPADTSASDGREGVAASQRGRSFITDRLIRESDPSSDQFGEVFDGGSVYRARMQVDGTRQPTTAQLLTMFPDLTLIE